MNVEPLYSAEQIVVPPELPDIIKAWTKEVIRSQPKDLREFSRQYFANLSALNKTTEQDLSGIKLTKSQLMRLREQLSAFDIRKTGFIESREIQEACETLQIPQLLLDKVFQLGNFSNPRQVDYNEFIILSLSLIAQNMIEVVEHIFEVFPDDSSKEILSDRFLKYFKTIAKYDTRIRMDIITFVAEWLQNETYGRVTFAQILKSPIPAKLQSIS